MTSLQDFSQALQCLDGKPEEYAVIFDVDGTLADVTALRQEWLFPAGNTSDFRGFHASSPHAPVIPWVRDAALLTQDCGVAVVIVTGRSTRWRDHTAWWLALNNIPSDALFMRHSRDHRPDSLVKQGFLDQIKASWSPLWAFDDNPSTIQVWLDAGIPVTIVPGWISHE